MRLHLVVPLIIGLVPAPAQRPSFDDFHVTVEQVARPRLDFSSNPIARRYRTVLREAIRAGPNFAGHFALAEWGCGSPCGVFAIVDLKSGAVFHDPELINSRGLDFKIDSRLLIVNPLEAGQELWPNVPQQFFIWENHKLVKWRPKR
jgi:hypothetical protein